MSSRRGYVGRPVRRRGRGPTAFRRLYGPEAREIERILLRAALEQGMGQPNYFREEQPNVSQEEIERAEDVLLSALEQEQIEDQTTVQRRRRWNNVYPDPNLRQDYPG